MQVYSSPLAQAPAAASRFSSRPAAQATRPDAVLFGKKSDKVDYAKTDFSDIADTAIALYDAHQDCSARYNNGLTLKELGREALSPVLLMSMMGSKTADAYRDFKTQATTREKAQSFKFSRLDVSLDELRSHFNQNQDVDAALKDLLQENIILKGDQEGSIMLTDKGWFFYENGLLGDIDTAGNRENLDARVYAKTGEGTLTKTPSLDQARFEAFKSKLSLKDKARLALLKNKYNVGMAGLFGSLVGLDMITHQWWLLGIYGMWTGLKMAEARKTAKKNFEQDNQARIQAAREQLEKLTQQELGKTPKVQKTDPAAGPEKPGKTDLDPELQ